MLDELHIRDVALIREASFSPAPGLSVITGETGTGKTALVGAIKMIVGERGDAALVREGADELAVEARFFFSDSSEDGTVASRKVSAQGRSRVTIDGTLSSVGELSAGIGASVDLCGQHEHQHLMKPVRQRELFDTWGASVIAPAHARYRDALQAVGSASAELARLEELAQSDTVALDRARFVIAQIDEVAPAPGEYEELLAEMPRLQHGEMLATESRAARAAISDENGALDAVNSALSSIQRMEAVDASLSETLERVRDAYYVLEDASSTLASYRDSIDFSPAEFQQRQERIASFQGLLRGFGPTMEDVFTAYDDAQRRIAEFDSRDELIAAAKRTLDEAEGQLQRASAELVEARSEMLPRFNDAVCAQLARLEMGTAQVQGVLEPLERSSWNEWGPHTFELFFRAGEDMKLQPLNKIASGGEISRVMLAIKVVLGAHDDAETLVFDEIDAGVGGQTARALGAVLEDLARTHQVIVVTHLPQIAVLGQAHYLVSKDDGALPQTHLHRIEGAEREREIARMLSGEVNETSLAHARELLSR